MCYGRQGSSATTGKKKKGRSGIAAGDDVLFIGGIPRVATQKDMRELFIQLYGENAVKRVRFVIDPVKKHHKGFGFCQFATAELAERAVKEYSKTGLLFNGKLLKIGQASENVGKDDESTVPSSSPPESDYDDLPELLDPVDDADQAPVLQASLAAPVEVAQPRMAAPVYCPYYVVMLPQTQAQLA